MLSFTIVESIIFATERLNVSDSTAHEKLIAEAFLCPCGLLKLLRFTNN